MKTQIGEHIDQLARPSNDMIAAGLKWLMDGGMMAPANIREGGITEEYAISLRDVPMCGLKTAFTKLKRGLYENINLDFIPTPATLAAMARLEARPVIENLSRLKITASTIEENSAPREKSSEEQRARIRDLHAQFKASHAAAKVTERFGNIDAPMTPEQAEYWKTIGGFKDAHEITEEHKAYRRKIDQAVGLYAGGEVYSPPQGTSNE